MHEAARLPVRAAELVASARVQAMEDLNRSRVFLLPAYGHDVMLLNVRLCCSRAYTATAGAEAPLPVIATVSSSNKN
eukprot:2733573-Pyramimonas_sp.AAC.1